MSRNILKCFSELSILKVPERYKPPAPKRVRCFTLTLLMFAVITDFFFPNFVTKVKNSFQQTKFLDFFLRL